MYDFEPNADGLLWNTLVQWWGSAHTSENIQKDLFKRLLNSLDSQPEKEFFYSILYNISKCERVSGTNSTSIFTL